jgi:RNA polymerase sigma factor (sigma-70 family)
VRPRHSLSEVFLASQSDERLCALVGDGHPAAFAALVGRHRTALIQAAARIAGPQQAEDVVQEALLRAWTTLRSGTSVQHTRGWLHQIVRNTACNHIARERPATVQLPVELADPQRRGAALSELLLARDLLAQIATLPERQRIALVETELGGRSRHQIAADLGLSDAAVRQLVHRARRAVRTAMTAITPYPLAAWAARHDSGIDAVDRLAVMLPPSGSGRCGLFESLAAGSAAGGGALLKAGAVIVAAGAFGGGMAWRELRGGPARHPAVHGRSIESRGTGVLRRRSVAITALVHPARVAALSPLALTAAGTARASRPQTQARGRLAHPPPGGVTAGGEGGDGGGDPANAALSSTSGKSSGDPGTDGLTASSSDGSGAGSGDTSGRSGSSDGAPGSSGDSSGDRSSGSSYDSSGGSVESSGGSTSDASAASSTTAGGGD